MGLTRRQVLRGLAGAAAAAGFGRRGRAATKGPVRVGFIAPFTGPFAQNGKDMWAGFRLYFEEIGMQAAGRPIQLISEDSWVEPAEALTKLRKLVESDQVHVASGGFLASTAYAIEPYVTAQKVPFVISVMSSDDVTQRKGSAWIVRVSWTSSQTTHPFGDYCYKTLGYRRVATMAPDFAFGYESLGGFQQVFEELGGKVAQKLWFPVVVSDFAPYLALLRRDIDAVFAVNSGAPAMRLLKQCADYGIEGKIPIIGRQPSSSSSTKRYLMPSSVSP